MEKHVFEMQVKGLTLEEAIEAFDWLGFFPIVNKETNMVEAVAYADSPEKYSHLEFDEAKEAYFI